MASKQGVAAAVCERLQQTFSLGRTRTYTWRKSQLLALQALLTEHQGAWYQALAADLGKPASEVWVTELGYLLHEIRYTTKHLRRWMSKQAVSSPLIAQPARSYLCPEPLGTVLIIGAWNYPLQLTLAPLIAAIAAGNCAVIKPSELSPNCAALLVHLLPQYLDPDTVAVVEGDADAATALLQLPFDHIFYTGGENVGKIVLRAAAEHLTPVTLELGGKSPCIVDATTNLAMAARRIAWGKWTNAGQTCIAPDYLLVERACSQDFIGHLKGEIERQYSANPLTSGDYGCIVNARHLARLQGYLDDQHLVIGGDVDVATCKMAPTVILNPDINSAVMQEEIFGPVLPILEISKVAEAIDLIKARPKPLAAYLFSHNKQVQRQVSAEISCGSLCINDVMMFMANSKLPFGGVGHSGMGQYHGKFGFDTFSHLKSVMQRPLLLDVALRYAPSSALKRYLLKKLL